METRKEHPAPSKPIELGHLPVRTTLAEYEATIIRLVVHYCVDVQHPEVSGTEHLEMLQIRDHLAEFESTLTAEEQQALAEADRVLVERANTFHQELLRFLDLAAYRREHGIPPACWWWYLDVISHLPPLKDEVPQMGHPTPRRL